MKVIISSHKLMAFCMLLIFAGVSGNAFAIKSRLSEKAEKIKRITDLSLEQVYSDDILNDLLRTAIDENRNAGNEAEKAMLKLVGLKVLFGKIYKSIASFDYSQPKKSDEIKSEILNSALQGTGILYNDENYIFYGQNIISDAELQSALDDLWPLIENVSLMVCELNGIKQFMGENNCDAAFKTAKLIIYADNAYTISSFAELIDREKERILDLLQNTADRYINAAAVEAALINKKSETATPEKNSWGASVLNRLKAGLLSLVQ